MHDGNLRVEPRPARADFARFRLGVNPALTPRFPLEMFDDVGDVGPIARNARLLERIVEKAAGGTDERASGKILIVARLFADEHHLGTGAAFTKNCLCGAPPEVTRAAAARGALQRTKSAPLGNRGRRRHLGSAGCEQGEHEQHEEHEEEDSREHLRDRERRAGDGREAQ
jgi:hypothetical protein